MFESESLNKILNAERASGNEIAEDTSWLPKCKKLIILKRKFQHPYKESCLEYQELNDPHYWFAEYHSADGTELLACKFA